LKSKFSILTVTVSAFMMIAFTTVPHHHHGVMMCMAAEYHGDVCHDTEGRSAAHHCSDANGYCAAEREYLVADQQEMSCRHFSCAQYHPPFPLLPALFVLVNLSNDLDAPPDKAHRYRPGVSLLTSAYTGQSHGLRAPPALLS
jgi:hypothetical protein